MMKNIFLRRLTTKTAASTFTTTKTTTLRSRHYFSLGQQQRPEKQQQQRNFTTTNDDIIDLRSDTVTKPSREMLEFGVNCDVGDDVMGEDPTVLELQEYMSNFCGKEASLFVPTGTMANLTAIMAHCSGSGGGSEVLVGQQSHICLWEGGNVSTVGSIFCRQIEEDLTTGQMNPNTIRNCIRHSDVDNHWPTTKVLCLENTHNMLGGIVLSPSYVHKLGQLCHNNNIALHIDGARFMNALIATQQQQQNTTASALLEHVDSMSICFSKGLGTPLGSVLVGSSELIQEAKRIRKRLGGGMRQAGIIAGMALFAMKHNNIHNVLKQDHNNAKRLAYELESNANFRIIRNGQIDTNIVYFQLPKDTNIDDKEFCHKLKEDYHVLVGGGYSMMNSEGGNLIRVVTHSHITDECIDKTIDAMIQITSR